MQYTFLGRTGLEVSRIVLGTMNFGDVTPEKESFTIMNNALDLGINFFDSANVYGYQVRVGLTEEIIGKWLSEDKSRREKIVLTTKVYCPVGKGPNERGLSAYHIRHACEESLRRLKTDHIDVYFMHHVDRGTARPLETTNFDLSASVRKLYKPPHRKTETQWEEVLQAMEVLVRQGKVLYLGSSNFAGWNIAQICERSAQRDFLGPVCEQSLYNLSSRTIELEVVPACRDYGLGIVSWSPLSGGLLGGVLESSAKSRRARIANQIEANREKLNAYESLCKKIGEKPADVALAWLLHNPVVSGPIIGPRTLDQLKGSLSALEIRLDEDLLRKLDEIWPGPGGEAPEAYAW
jgi:aryl-alcohol dehydrogenase-like predicted oxidoreductase